MHRRLLHKLKIINIPKYLFNIINSCLSNKKILEWNDAFFYLKSVSAGVLQDFKLGTFLFTVFIPNIPFPQTIQSIQ